MRIFIEFMPCLGDLVTELPILHALRERIHPLDVEVSADRAGVALLEDYDWIGRRHVRLDDWGSRLGPIASSYRQPFDLLLYLRSNPAIKLNRLLVRARRKLGAEAYDEAVQSQGVVRHRFSILRQVLGDLPEIRTRIDLKPERARDALLLAGFGEGAHVLCLGPGAGSPQRRWPVGRFATLAWALRDRFDGIAVLGSPAEAELCAELAGQVGAVSLAGWSLGSVAGLLARSALYLGNDSGLAHLAAAQGCPTASIGLTDPYYTPWNGHGVPGRPNDLSAEQVLTYLKEHVLGAAPAARPA